MPDTPPPHPTRSGAIAARVATTNAFPPAPTFDWRALVAQTQPGDATPSQRAQAARLQAAITELSAWAEQFGLLIAYVKPSAMFAVVCTAPDTSADLTRSLARLILWYYSFDTTLDTQPDERLGDAGWVNAAIRVCLHPLLSDLRFGVLRRLGESAVPYAAKEPMPPSIHRLVAALTSWRATTLYARQLLGPDDPAHLFWRSAMAEELVRAALTMQQELAWTSAWRSDTLTEAPTSRAYMLVASRTVGVHPTFALGCAGLGVAPQAWRERRPLLDAAARVIRLANDAATAENDLAARNLTAVTLSALRISRRQTGRATSTIAPPRAATALTLQPSDGAAHAAHAEHALRRARAQGRRRLDTAVGAFAQRLADQPPGPDADFLRYTVAWALAHYAQT